MLKTSFLAEDAFEPKMLFWVLLGPIFIIFSLLLTSLGTDLPNGDLWAVAIIGIGLCSIFQRKGFLLSISFLVALSLLKHLRISQNHAWQFGLETTVFLGFVITYISFEFLSQWISSFETHKKSLLHKQSLLEEEIGREEEFFIRQKKGWQELIDEKENKIEALKEEMLSFLDQKTLQAAEEKNLKFSIHHKDMEISSLKEKITHLEQKIQNPLDESVFEEKISILEKANQDLIENQKKELSSLKEKLDAMEGEKHALLTEIDSLKQGIKVLKKMQNEKQPVLSTEEREIHYLYKQLKKQFDEKGKTLHQARKDLFHTQEKLEATKREMKEKFYQVHPKEKEFFSKVDQLQSKIETLTQENSNLQSVVSSLNAQLSLNSKSSQEKNPPLSGEQLSLF